jgi:hypothetical protein
MSEPTYVGMPGNGERHQLRLTMTQSPEGDYTECTVRIPKALEVEAGPAPTYATVGDNWMCLQDAKILGELGYHELAPEGLAMKFLRLAWLAAHDEIARKDNGGSSDAD